MANNNEWDTSQLRSQQLRKVNRQGDSLRIGSGWSERDLSKPQIMIESVYGDSHPGSTHLNMLVEEVRLGVFESGGRPGRHYATDVCDGIAQVHDGMNYSLLSRDMLASMTEMHALAHPYDALVCISSCDKANPGHLMGIARVNMPAIHVPGGTQSTGPDLLSSDMLYDYGDRMDRGELTFEELMSYTRNACPSCGACHFMGTASTGQVMSETLGMALPGTALAPASTNHMRMGARTAGQQVLELLKRGIKPRDILVKEAFENAIIVHAAIGGSSNFLLHLPAIAREAGIEIRPEDFDEIHQKVPVLANVKTSGKYSAEQFWYAGGVPAIMNEVRDLLHLDVMTVTGRTLGENLDHLKKTGFLAEVRRYLSNYKITWRDVIYPREKPFKPYGALAILRGNLAPGGAVTKRSAVPAEMQIHEGPARPFDSEEAAIEALLHGGAKPGDVVIVRYEGPRGSGMPEMVRCTEIIVNNPELATTTAILTDGRFSGVSRGPAVGHISPEASEGGPLALVEFGDIIRIDIPARRLDIVELAGPDGARTRDPRQIEQVLAERRERWKVPAPRFTSGILGMYCRSAASPMQGGYMM